jgi:hypothetical protein
LRDEDLYLAVEHDYPALRQSVIKFGVEADEVATESMIEAVLGNTHGEEIELWASQIRGVMVECREMLLVELQERSGLDLVDLWLGLLDLLQKYHAIAFSAAKCSS